MKVDTWVWGRELIVWGYDPSHEYTFKILEPAKGRQGCLSLQYHLRKSETWLVLRGTVWALIVSEGVVCTRIMKPGDIQNITVGMIHRLMGITSDARVAEPSTSDEHAADKKKEKDVMRLHCVLGRPVSAPRDSAEKLIVDQAIEFTEEAIHALEAGKAPPEHNLDLLLGKSGFRLP